MAELLTTNCKRNSASKKLIKKNTRVDLTPMVDLGFLLISFFVFTTSMTTPRVMNMAMPNDNGMANDPVCESCVLTILPGKDNRLYYYEGAAREKNYKQTSYSPEGLRALLVKKKQAVIAARNNDQFVLIIKPSAESNFKQLVDIIDESNICRVKRYYIAELTEMDRLVMDR